MRAQFALFRIHGADQDESSIVAMGNTVALDAVGATGGHIQQQVHQRIGQQVDLIHVKHAPMGLGQYAGRKLRLALPQRGIQVEGTDQALLGGA